MGRTLDPGFKTDARLAGIVDIIVETVEPDKIILFGSRARDEEGAGSDYDLLIVKNGISNERTISRLTYRSLLEHCSAVPVDILVADERMLQKARGKIGDVLTRILAEGRQIYARA